MLWEKGSGNANTHPRTPRLLVTCAADDQQSLSQPIAQTSQRPPPSRDFPFLSTAARPAPATASGSVCPVPWLSLYVTTDVGGALALQKDVFQ